MYLNHEVKRSTTIHALHQIQSMNKKIKKNILVMILVPRIQLKIYVEGTFQLHSRGKVFFKTCSRNVVTQNMKNQNYYKMIMQGIINDIALLSNSLTKRLLKLCLNREINSQFLNIFKQSQKVNINLFQLVPISDLNFR